MSFLTRFFFSDPKPVIGSPSTSRSYKTQKKTDGEKPKTNEDKAKTDGDKAKTNEDKANTDGDKAKTDGEKANTEGDITKTGDNKLEEEEGGIPEEEKQKTEVGEAKGKTTNNSSDDLCTGCNDNDPSTLDEDRVADCTDPSSSPFLNSRSDDEFPKSPTSSRVKGIKTLSFSPRKNTSK